MIEKTLTATALVLGMATAGAAQAPFSVATIATLQQPWAMVTLPQGGLLVTEKTGRVVHLDDSGAARDIMGGPKVSASGQTGLHDIALAPDFDTSGLVYMTFVSGWRGGALQLGRGRLDLTAQNLRFDDFEVLWQAKPRGGQGHPGGIIAFSDDGALFLTSGDRQLADPAQDLSDSRGKILRLTLDGEAAPGNPFPEAPEVWSLGHRNAYGLVFDDKGQLWSHEMGPSGGDELNLITAGQNYGWPLVSEGQHYNGTPIPDHASRPDFTAPLLEWTPVVAPAGMIHYQGAAFPELQGSLLIGGLASQALVQVVPQADGAQEVARWTFENRIRDVASAVDGSLYLLEDGDDARLLRLSRQ